MMSERTVRPLRLTRLIPAFFAVILLAAILIACSRESDDDPELTPESVPPAPACTDGRLRCAEGQRIQECDAGKWLDDYTCPLLTRCEQSHVAARPKCAAVQLPDPALAPIAELRVSRDELALKAPDPNTSLGRMIQRLDAHYKLEPPARMAGDRRRMGLSISQRRRVMRLALYLMFNEAYDILKGEKGFKRLDQAGTTFSETERKDEYHLLYVGGDERGKVPAARLEIMLSTDPDSGVPITPRLRNWALHELGVYLTIGYRPRNTHGVDKPALPLAELAERWEKVLGHFFYEPKFSDLGTICTNPQARARLFGPLDEKWIPAEWRNCEAKCEAALRALDMRLPVDPNIHHIKGEETPSWDYGPALVCAGLAMLDTEIAVDGRPLKPNLRLGQDWVQKTLLNFKPTEAVRIFVGLADSGVPAYQKALVGLKQADAEALREVIGPIVKAGPGKLATRLMDGWVRGDLRQATETLMAVWPSYKNDRPASQALLGALAYNPDKAAREFLLARLKEGKSSPKVLRTLLDGPGDQSGPARDWLQANFATIDSPMANEALDWLMAIKPRLKPDERPDELLKAVENLKATTRNYETYRLCFETLGLYADTPFKRPERPRELDSYVQSPLSDVQAAAARRFLLPKLSPAGQLEIIWLFDYARHLDGEPRARLEALLRDLVATQNTLWRTELARLAELKETPQVATLASAVL